MCGIRDMAIVVHESSAMHSLTVTEFRKSEFCKGGWIAHNCFTTNAMQVSSINYTSFLSRNPFQVFQFFGALEIFEEILRSV